MKGGKAQAGPSLANVGLSSAKLGRHQGVLADIAISADIRAIPADIQAVPAGIQAIPASIRAVPDGIVIFTSCRHRLLFIW